MGRKSDNIAIIVDEKDFLVRWLHELTNAFASIDHKANVHAFNIYDVEKCNIKSPTKVVFLLTQESCSIKKQCVTWLKKFKQKTRNVPPYRIIHVQNDPQSKEDIEGISEENVFRIKDIAEIYSWWPKLSAFLFDISKSTIKTCYVLNLSTGFEKASTISSMLKTGLSDIGLPQADIIADADCVVCFSKDGDVDVESLEVGALRRAKMKDRPIHGILFEGEEPSVMFLLTTTYQHFVYDKTPLRPFLCILSDLLAGRPFPPSGPLHFVSMHGNDVILTFLESKTCQCFPVVKGESVDIVIEIRDVACCLTKTSDWEEIQRVPSKGPGQTHSVAFFDIGRTRSFQFRIMSEGVHRRSEPLVTSVFGTLGTTEVTCNSCTTPACMKCCNVVLCCTSFGLTGGDCTCTSL